MFGLFDGLIESVFGKDNFVSSALKTVMGLATMGAVGYVVYKGVSYAIKGSDTAKKTPPQVAQGTSKPAIASGNVKSPTSNDGGIKIDPAFLRNKSSAEQNYASIYRSYTEGKATNSNKSENLVNAGQWTQKITTPDGSVLYKDAQGSIATKGSDGSWQYFNSQGEYVQTKPAVKSVSLVSNIASNTVKIG